MNTTDRTFAADVAKLKIDITKHLVQLLDAFHQQHGVSPKSIYVSFNDVTTPADEVKRFMLSGVDVEFNL